MKVRITVGKGVTGAVRYVMGPGKDAAAGLFPGGSDGPAGRVGWISGQGFGFQIKTFEQADLARRVMEFDARHQASKTKQCVYDCVHIVLAWERGEMPSRERMEEACRSQLKAQGMENVKAIFVAHNDEDYFHVHIGASKINPATGRVYDLAGSWRKASLWAEQYEREHGGVVTVNRQSANELRRAIKERDIEGVLEAMARRNATFTARQLERAVQKEIYPETGAADGKKHTVELERAQFVNAILTHESVLRLAKEHNGPVHCYTTRSIRDAETYVLNAAAGLKADTGHGIGEDKRAAVLAGKYGAMTAEQLHAFRHCTGDEGLALIDGQAGTGKSFTMAAIRNACEADGRHVVGLAFTNKVAKNLARDGFSHTATVHRALMDLNNGRTAWNAKTVVMVDEAAMLDTKLMAMLTAHAHDAGAKLILVGDDRQLSSIDCGGMFGVLKDRHGAAVLSEARRQYKPDEKRASEMMAEGNFDTALAIYDRKGAIHWTRTQKEAREELVEKWARDTAENNGKTRFVFAYCNIDVDALNAALRAVRKERGELEWEDHSIRTANGRFDFSAGDRVQFTGTNKRLGIDNADTGTIEMIEGEKLRVRLDGPERKIVEFEAGSFGHFRHGYAGTVWKGQGDTLDQTYLYHSEHWRSAPSYVALTRHRERTDLFVATNTAKDLAALAKQVARQDETRAASAFYQLDQIEPVRPMKAKEILAQFAGEQFRKAAERMQREARRWHERHYNPRPHPPWPSLRERLAPEWGDGDAIERLAVNENIRARMARRAQQREGNRPVDELWEEEKRKRRSGSAMDMDIRPRKPVGQQLGDEAPRYPASQEIAGAKKDAEIQPETIARLKPSEPERGGAQPDAPAHDPAGQGREPEIADRVVMTRDKTYTIDPGAQGTPVEDYFKGIELPERLRDSGAKVYQTPDGPVIATPLRDYLEPQPSDRLNRDPVEEARDSEVAARASEILTQPTGCGFSAELAIAPPKERFGCGDGDGSADKGGDRASRPGPGHGSDVQDHDAARRKRSSTTTAGSAPAVVPEIDHRIGEGLECVVQLTEAIKAKQQPPILVFPSEHSFNRVKSLVKNSRLKERLAAALGSFSAARIGIDVGDHATIENRFAVQPTIIDAIEADDGAAKVHADHSGDARHFRQRLSQQ